MIVTCKSRGDKGGQVLDVRQPVNLAVAERLGLVSWWKSFGSGGNIARDLMRTKNCTLTNGAKVAGAGRSGGYGSFFFDGSDDYGAIASDSRYGITTDITCSCAIKKSSSNATILVKQSSVADQWDYLFFVTNNRLMFYADGQTPSVLTSTGSLPSGWSNVAVVRRSGVVSFYIRGSLDSSFAQTGTFNNNAFGLFIGQDRRDASIKLTGYLDNIKLFNRGLTASEIYWLRHDDKRGNPRMLNWIEDIHVKPPRGAAMGGSVFCSPVIAAA